MTRTAKVTDPWQLVAGDRGDVVMKYANEVVLEGGELPAHPSHEVAIYEAMVVLRDRLRARVSAPPTGMEATRLLREVVASWDSERTVHGSTVTACRIFLEQLDSRTEGTG